MSWEPDGKGIVRWAGDFIEPPDYELAPYVGARQKFGGYVCGTARAYAAHYRRGEPPCLPCRDAYNAKKRADRARKREAA